MPWFDVFNKNSASKFDCVVIVRWGGEDYDLNLFNKYEVAETIARIPIPVN